ncbi:hypothetical protein BKA62DRAFT_689361 [Auriculariales sp. MPI-PUGE-AT-0066]|nr:hypothetical protein BKA62DRAFT_689361 [Auriculariales sp. MPI-PUGE-AT-0066]
MGTAAPDDILLLIYDLVAHPAPLPWPNAMYDPERAQAPFTLAAICQRWRMLAVSTAGIWTYFGFPPAWAEHKPHLLRLHLLLARSKEAEVDVVCRWRNNPDKHHLANYETMGVISSIASRWRNVTLNVPRSFASIFARAFNQQWHCLRYLSLEYQTQILELPLAPQLAYLYFEGLECPNSLPDVMPYLSRLSINGDGARQTNTLLLSLAHQLTDLCILEDVAVSPQQPILFPRLLSLTVDDVSYLNHIQAPSLQMLSFNASRLYYPPDLAPFAYVRHLCLYGHLREPFVSSLRQFTDITQLTLEVSDHSKRAWPGIDKYKVYRGFFEALWPSPPNSASAWPRLERIHLGHPGSTGPEAITEPQELIDFVARRNAAYEDSDETGDVAKLRPARIQAITVDFEGASEWLISELNRVVLLASDANRSSI